MSKYTNWSKEALISKILALESKDSSTSDAQSPKPSAKPKRDLDFSKFSKRRIAIRFAYLGWNYHGLAFQKQGHRTVESEILYALYKTRCIESMDPLQCNFSRCGRTDAGVSAMAQVISLDVRSLLSEDQHTNKNMDHKELDYLKTLNSQLPPDILPYQVCLRPPPDFDARFSCTGRHYHYYFDGEHLDLSAMQEAADQLVGEHDFRNFCKIDGSKQITNFVRRVVSSKIEKQPGSDGLHYLSLKGTAFLWNQVRSIMAILLLVGQRLEDPSIVSTLLDVEKTPRRPAYEIAWSVPLVLQDCEFPPMEWLTSRYTSLEPTHNVWHELLQKQAITRTMLAKAAPHAAPLTPEDLRSRINIGQGIGRKSAKYAKLANRPVAESFEVVNRKWLEKKTQRLSLSDSDGEEKE